MSENKNISPDNSDTVIVRTGDVARRLSEEKTVLDTRPENSRSLFDDPELEAIIRETEGYDLEPEDNTYDDEPYTPPQEPSEPEYDDERPESNAQRVAREQGEKLERKKKKKLILIGVGIVAVLAVVLCVILAVRSGDTDKDYQAAFSRAQEYYAAGEYDKALDKLREAMGIKKEDECLLLMSRCYEEKLDYVNAIAILESSTSGSEEIKSEIERLKKAKEEYDSGQIVIIGGEQYDVETTVLDLSGKAFTSSALKELSKLTELTSLKLANNKITSLDFLKPLKSLTSLDLSKNKISDISPLKSLTSLRTLHLDNNEIKDFSPLYELDGLSMLTISGIEIGQAQLKQLKEKLPGCIIYSDDAKEDVLEIKLGGKTFKSDVTELNLSGCNVRDISALSVCTKLKKLDLSNNSISSISALVDIPGLTELDLSNNKITDISPLMSVTALEYLNLSGNNVKSVAALRELTGLRELNLSGNPLSGISAVSKLVSMKTLWLDNVGLKDTDLSGLYSLKALKRLSIKDNANLSESAVTALQNKLTGCTISHSELKRSIELGGERFLSDSETVEAKGLDLSDISAVSGFSAVKHLDLSDNKISNLSPLSSLKTLETLDLRNNKISDVTALSGLTNLKQLWLGGNELSSDQIDALKKALPNCYISVE